MSNIVATKDIKTWEEALKSEMWIAPAINMYETESEYVLLIDMPGVRKDNVRIKLENEFLIIMGRIDYDIEIKKRYLVKEADIANYFRKLKVGDSIDESNIHATLELGQLTIRLPKHNRMKPRIIEVK